MLREAIAPDLPTLHRQLEDMTAHHPDPMRAAARLLGTLRLEVAAFYDIAPPDW